ncbi:histidine kinase [Streptomyces kunmingensis]|uniref:Histidine kinase n=1 Tax=Streptomyces kunmingensis TaxID=68225 RepID=A0ABU6CLR1_9ACTN|nr:histidine kinase [Streptomyces kunmingensis]MEB3965643.1 histidine kinase [Streptomyces kunmingensis]
MRGRWRERSKVERVEWQSRLMLRSVNWAYLVAWSGPTLVGSLRHDAVAVALGCALAVVNVVQCVVAHFHLRGALDQYLGRGPVSPALSRTAAGLLVTALGLIAALTATDSVKDGLIALPLLFAPMPFCCAYVLTVPVRTFLRQSGVGVVAALGLFAAVGSSLGRLLALAVVLGLSIPLELLTARCSAWNLSVMWESEHAREVEARLAVAEERLRFGRDLHDVMGRNLAVVALKSELAVQLARRGRTEDAVTQMIEVQRIARDSQKEVRDVVRGYREADLEAELGGVRGVLSAAGIDCTVTGSAAGLPPEVQSVLGWVVREATTNVLRHGDAKSCRVRLENGTRQVVLTVENDGVGNTGEAGTAVSGNRGSGLAGLRERLAALEGTLEAGVVSEGVFRVTASVPLTAAGDAAKAAGVPAADAAETAGAPAADAADVTGGPVAEAGEVAGGGESVRARWAEGVR